MLEILKSYRLCSEVKCDSTLLIFTELKLSEINYEMT